MIWPIVAPCGTWLCSFRNNSRRQSSWFYSYLLAAVNVTNVIDYRCQLLTQQGLGYRGPRQCKISSSLTFDTRTSSVTFSTVLTPIVSSICIPKHFYSRNGRAQRPKGTRTLDNETMKANSRNSPAFPPRIQWFDPLWVSWSHRLSSYKDACLIFQDSVNSNP